MMLYHFHIHSGQFTHQRYIRLLWFFWSDFTHLEVSAHEKKKKSNEMYVYMCCMHMLLRNWLKQLLMLSLQLFGLFWLDFWWVGGLFLKFSAAFIVFTIPGAWCTCLHIVLLYCLTIWLLLTDNPWRDTWPQVLSFSGSLHVFVPLSCVFPPFTEVCVQLSFMLACSSGFGGLNLFSQKQRWPVVNRWDSHLGIAYFHIVEHKLIFLLTCHISQMCFR